MPRENKSKHTGKQKRLAGDVEPGNERRPDSQNEAERRARATEIRKTPVGKTSGSGRRPHSPRDTLPR